MPENENERATPMIWFEGQLIRDPQPIDSDPASWLLETTPDAQKTRRKITVLARGENHAANIREHARKGCRLIIKGTAGDEGSGIEINALTIAFDPSREDTETTPDGDDPR